MVLPVGMLDKDIKIQYLTTNAFYNSINAHIEKTRKALEDEQRRYNLSKLNRDLCPKTNRRMYVNVIDLTDKLRRLEESEKNIKRKLDTFYDYSVTIDRTA